MPEMPDVLERASRAVHLEQGDFERLLHRRERKQRDQRIRAGVLGAIVALVAAAILARSMTSGTIPADPPMPPLGTVEVLEWTGQTLGARDPESGTSRTIIDDGALPGGCEDECSFGTSEHITGAAWSNDHTWVAFRAGGLLVAHTEGGEPRQITADQGWWPWAWSPTEDRLAVVLGGEVRLVDVSTGRETDLGTMFGSQSSDGFPSPAFVWSPDGTRIAYSGGPGGGSVYSIDIESGEHAVLVDQPAGMGRVENTDWSPGGAHLAISYQVGPSTALYLAEADGSDPRLLTDSAEGQRSVWHPGLSVGTAWSPDGTRFAYTTLFGPDDGDATLWTVSIDGSAPALVLSRCCVVGLGGPAWSPDGSRIVVETEPSGDQPHDHMVVNADGTGEPSATDETTHRSWLDGWYFCFCYG